MKKVFFFVLGCLFLLACNNKPAETTAAKTDSSATTASETKTPPQSEFADPKYTEIGKKMLEQMSSGNMDGWNENFADNAVYRWSSGDSLAGKEAIAKYWTERRTKVIDSISFTNDIWLPVKVNTPQKGPDTKGVWLLSWYLVNAKYKNGNKVGFFVHTDFHFNDADKVDQAIQYIDRVPINKALGIK
jgi:hypothetical protein